MDTVDRLIKSIGNSSRVLVLVGAGISVNAGIPDFRSPVLGIYNRYNFDVEDALHIESFKDDPTPFYRLICELGIDKNGTVKTYSPTITHRFLKQLHDAGKLLRIYSQNIDGLDCEPIGLRANENVIQCHGSLSRIVCASCGREQATKFQDWIGNVVKHLNCPGPVPTSLRCTFGRCEGYTKPDVVLFGESLPPSFFRNIQKDTQMCDLVIVLGSSMSVFPFAAIPAMLHADSVERFIICKNFPGSTSAILIDQDCDEVTRRVAQALNFKSID